MKKDLSPQKLRRFDILISISTIFFWALWVFCWAEVGVLIGNLSAALPSKRPQTYRIFLTGLIHRDSRYRYSNAIRFRFLLQEADSSPAGSEYGLGQLCNVQEKLVCAPRCHCTYWEAVFDKWLMTRLEQQIWV